MRYIRTERNSQLIQMRRQEESHLLYVESANSEHHGRRMDKMKCPSARCAVLDSRDERREQSGCDMYVGLHLDKPNRLTGIIFPL